MQVLQDLQSLHCFTFLLTTVVVTAATFVIVHLNTSSKYGQQFVFIAFLFYKFSSSSQAGGLKRNFTWLNMKQKIFLQWLFQIVIPTFIICDSVKFEIRRAASSSPVIPRTVLRSSAIVKELIAWVVEVLARILHSFKKRGSFSNSFKFTLLVLDHSDKIETIWNTKIPIEIF